MSIVTFSVSMLREVTWAAIAKSVPPMNAKMTEKFGPEEENKSCGLQISS